MPIVGDFVEAVIGEVKGTTQVEETQKDTDIFEQYNKAKEEINENT